MQLQALLRAGAGRPLEIMFPFVAEPSEFTRARAILGEQLERERQLGHELPTSIRVGAMLETPSIAFAPRSFFTSCDFLSIGGNDLKQFFFAADRENELVRRRYDTLNVSFLSFIESIVKRCEAHDTPLSFCGEDAGRPVEAAVHARHERPARVIVVYTEPDADSSGLDAEVRVGRDAGAGEGGHAAGGACDLRRAAKRGRAERRA